MKVTVYNQKGNKTKSTFDLEDNVFSADVNSDLMAQALYVYRSNQRLGTQKTKGISEVSGGGKKPWKQKTPDRARHGSTRSPIWVGGGDAHPISPRTWRLRLSKKMRQGAIFSAFSEKIVKDSLFVIDSLELESEKLTQQVDSLYKSFSPESKLLVVTDGKKDNLLFGSRSLKKVDVVTVGEINIYDIIKNDKILITKDAATKINDRWGSKKEKSLDKKEKK